MSRFTTPLDNIRVASPCSADWNQMYGNDRKRFCSDCKLNVYNLSDMSRQDAENFLVQSEGSVCVRYFRRPDGSVLTKDCPVGLRAFKKRLQRTVFAGFSLIAGFLSSFAVLKFLEHNPEPRYEVMGAIPVPTKPISEVPIEEYPEILGAVDMTDFERARKKVLTSK